MARTRGRVGLIVAGLCWGSALGLALGALVLAPAMPGSVDLGFSDSKAGTSDDAQRDDSDRAAAQSEAMRRTHCSPGNPPPLFRGRCRMCL